MLHDVTALSVLVAPQVQSESVNAHENRVVTRTLKVSLAFDATVTHSVFWMNLKDIKCMKYSTR